MAAETQVFDFERHGDVLIITPLGRFMEHRDHDFRNAYNDAYRILCEPGVRHLLVDFSKMDYFGSMFVGILIRLSRKVRSGGGEAFLCNLSSDMRQMLKTLMLLENTKTDFFWRVCESRDDGLQRLAEYPPADQPAAG